MAKQSDKVLPKTLVYCCVATMGILRAVATLVMYFAVCTTVSMLWINGRKRSCTSQSKSAVVEGDNLPTARRVTAEADMGGVVVVVEGEVVLVFDDDDKA